MITTKKVRRVPTHVTRCQVCRERMAPQGANVCITVDAESEATAISTITHSRCAETIVEFTRERGYTPAELTEVGIWAEQEAR